MDHLHIYLLVYSICLYITNKISHFPSWFNTFCNKPHNSSLQPCCVASSILYLHLHPLARSVRPASVLLSPLSTQVFRAEFSSLCIRLILQTTFMNSWICIMCSSLRIGPGVSWWFCCISLCANEFHGMKTGWEGQAYITAITAICDSMERQRTVQSIC